MNALLDQLGIDWKLFASQAINFFILLLVLWQFVYKPLLATVKKRQKIIEDGLAKAQEAATRLKQVDEIAKERLRKAQDEAVLMIRNAQERAVHLEHSLTMQAEQHHQEMLKQLQAAYEKEREGARHEVFQHASELLKNVVAKAVALDPRAVDEALIKKAVSYMKSHEA